MAQRKESTEIKPRTTRKMANNAALITPSPGALSGLSPGEIPEQNLAASQANAAQSAKTPTPVVYRDIPATDANEGNVSDMWRLPNYERDGKTDRDSREWAGQVMNTVDWLRQVEAMYGAGYYIRVPRLVGGKFGREMFCYVPPSSTITNSNNTQTSNSELDYLDEWDGADDEPVITLAEHKRTLAREIENIRLQERVNSLERLLNSPTPTRSAPSLLQQLRELKEAQELLAPTPQLQQNPATAATPEMAIIEAFVKSPACTPELMEQIIPAALGMQGKGETNWLDLVKTGLEALPSVMGMLSRFTPPAQPMPQAQNVEPMHYPNAPMPPARSIEHFQNPTEPARQPAPQTPQDANGFQAASGHLMQITLQAIHSNDSVEPIAERFNALLNMYPQEAEGVEALLSQTPEVLATMLAQAMPGADVALNQPHAKDWIERFQQAFFDGEDEGDGEPEKPATQAAAVTAAGSVRTL